MSSYAAQTLLPKGIYEGKRVACVGPAGHSNSLVESYDLVVRFNGHWKTATGRTDILYVNSQKLWNEVRRAKADIPVIVHRPNDLHTQARVRFRVGMLIGLLAALDAHRNGAKEIFLTGMDVYEKSPPENHDTGAKGLIHSAMREIHLDTIYLMDLYIPQINLDHKLRDILQAHLLNPNLPWVKG